MGREGRRRHDAMTPTGTREPIYCDCHGNVVMGYRANGIIVWYDKRHGHNHFKALPEHPMPGPAQGGLTSNANDAIDRTSSDS